MSSETPASTPAEVVLPLAEVGAEPSQPKSTSNHDITIAFPPASIADDAAFVSTMVKLVNAAYSQAEGSLFIPGYVRTTTDEIEGYLRREVLAIARITGQEQPIGCVYVERSSDTQGKFGMLALDVTYRGGGLGRRLVNFAEEECRREGRTQMRVEALVPTNFRDPLKERLNEWYLRLGYQLVEIGRFDVDYPAQARQLAGPTDYKVFTKSLVSST